MALEKVDLQKAAAELTDSEVRGCFREAGDFVARELMCGEERVYTYYIDGLTSGSHIAEYVFRPLMANLRGTPEQMYRQALLGNIYCASVKPCRNLEEVLGKLVNGFCVLLFPGAGAAAFETKTGVVRNPGVPEVENTVKGPKDAFVETLRINTSLIRRHLRTPELRFFEMAVGRQSRTNVAVVWLDGVTDQGLVEKMKNRLKDIEIRGMITPSAVEECVSGSRKTAFPLLQYTERTDKFCQGLLDGRVGLVVDGLPLAYLLPVDLGYFMESAEDRGRDYLTASAIRILRYLALAVDLLLPGLYVALTTWHPMCIPEKFLAIVMESRENIPYSPAGEVLGLLIAFELLQESGVHLPQAVGQSVSVVGGIVVGSAAVEAGLVSPLGLIVVSIAGICGFVLPNRDFAEGVRVWRVAGAVAAALLGIPGLVGIAAWLTVHLLRLRSLGVPYLKVRGQILRKQYKNEKKENK